MHLFVAALHYITGHLNLFEITEFFLTLAMILLAFTRPDSGARLFGRLEGRLAAVAARPLVSIILVAALAAICRAVFAPVLGVPDPIITDEVSLVLQAETYASGHFTNSIDLSPDFQSIYMILKPSYSSMYPVLRSLPMVVGKLAGIGLFGGVWLCMLALCALTYWALSAFLPRRYALLAALVNVLRFGVFSWWVNTYFSPAFTAIGGLLLLGGYGRLVKRPTLLNGSVLGLGVLILMTTRPLEGLAFAAPFAVALAIRFFKAPRPDRSALALAGVAAFAFVAAGFALTLAQDRAVTGNALLPPDTLYRQTRAQAAPFLFQKAIPNPLSPYVEQSANSLSELKDYDHRKTLKGIVATEGLRNVSYFTEYVGFALLVPFLIGALALRRARVLVAATFSLWLCLAIETFPWPHYAAPALGVIMIAIVLGLQRLRSWRPRDKPVGLALSRLLPVGLLLGYTVPVYASLADPRLVLQPGVFTGYCCQLPTHTLHGSIERALAALPGRNIVVVDQSWRKYGVELMVFNHADIQGARTIWVHADPRYTPATIERFADRNVWFLGWLDDHRPCLQFVRGAGRGSTASAPARCVGGLGGLAGSPEAPPAARPPFPLSSAAGGLSPG